MYLTFKIEIDQFMTNVNPKNGNETKSGNFPYGELKSNIIFLLQPMTFAIGIFQFYSKSEQKQVKENKVNLDMCKFDIIFPYLQSIIVFK